MWWFIDAKTLHMTLLTLRQTHSASSDGSNGLQDLVVQFFFGQLMLKMCVVVEPDVVHYVQCRGKNLNMTFFSHHHAVKTSYKDNNN